MPQKCFLGIGKPFPSKCQYSAKRGLYISNLSQFWIKSESSLIHVWAKSMVISKVYQIQISITLEMLFRFEKVLKLIKTLLRLEIYNAHIAEYWHLPWKWLPSSQETLTWHLTLLPRNLIVEKVCKWFLQFLGSLQDASDLVEPCWALSFKEMSISLFVNP